MENNNNNTIKPRLEAKKWSDPSPSVAIFGYLLIQFVLAAFITYLITFIYSKISGLGFEAIMEVLAMKNENPSPELIKAAGIVNGYGNFFIYLFSTAFVIFYTRNLLKDDYISFKNDIKYHSWYIPAAIVAFTILTTVVNYLVGMAAGESTNQSTIVDVLNSPGKIPMLLSVVILAPIIEELIYRKSILEIAKNQPVWLQYVFSVGFFALPHMLSTNAPVGTWLLLSIPYVFSGFLLVLIYRKGKGNIYTSMAVHFFNNLLTGILILLGV